VILFFLSSELPDGGGQAKVTQSAIAQVFEVCTYIHTFFREKTLTDSVRVLSVSVHTL
jgi:hypothetical protein